MGELVTSVDMSRLQSAVTLAEDIYFVASQWDKVESTFMALFAYLRGSLVSLLFGLVLLLYSLSRSCSLRLLRL